MFNLRYYDFYPLLEKYKELIFYKTSSCFIVATYCKHF